MNRKVLRRLGRRSTFTSRTTRMIQRTITIVALCMLALGAYAQAPAAPKYREYRGGMEGRTGSIVFGSNGKWAIVSNEKDFDQNARMGDYIETADRFILGGGSQGEAFVVRKQANTISIKQDGQVVFFTLVK